jgi:2-keto-4-pentenoate hydratase/2-oxohepta-3-ene-1,7-dioic acid hydratase in catechol pathway
MNIGRILYQGRTAYAAITDGQAKLIEGDIWGDWEVSDRTAPLAEVELLAPVEPKQVVAIGLNYYQHAKECNMDIPREPLLFLKGVNTVTGPDKPVVLPAMAPDEVDYEAELVIVIGKEAKNIGEAEAGDHILGYTCGNDVSARDCQLKKDSQWARGKSFDTFAPIGPWITTGIEPDNLKISLTLNGQVMQSSSTSDLIFSCRKLVSFLSQCMTLYPGSIIMTGTPAGVGIGRTPQVFLKAGDEVTVEIENIGTLTNIVKKER